MDYVEGIMCLYFLFHVITVLFIDNALHIFNVLLKFLILYNVHPLLLVVHVWIVWIVGWI